MRFLFLFLWLLLCGTVSAATLGVGEGEAYGDIASALAAARDGDTVAVGPGIYRESGLVVDRRLRLEGRGWPVIDAGGAAQVLAITASGASVSGLVVRNGGFSALEDPAGIRVAGAEHVEIRANRIEECAFGVFFSETRDSLVVGNRISTSRGDEHNSGNGIHLWSCKRIAVENNIVIGHRDGIYLEFAVESRIVGNHFTGNTFEVTAAGRLEGFVIVGNHWDSYSGYDLDRDGVGDVPHHPVRLFGVVVERESAALLLLRSPVVHLLDRIERAFPTLTPETLVDSAPAMRPPALDLGDVPPPGEAPRSARPRQAGSKDRH